MQLKEPEPPERAEVLVLGGLTVATWVLVVAFAVVAGELERGTEQARAQTQDTIETLRRLPASRPETFHVEHYDEPEEEEHVGPD